MNQSIIATTLRVIFPLFLALNAGSLFAFDQSHYPPSTTIPIIFDTDMGPDIDDVGALAILHAFADIGTCSIVAVGVNSPEPYGCCCADVINTYYQRPGIPIGIVKNGPGVPTSQNYSKPITEQFPNDLKNSMDKIPDAVLVYRQVLSRQADSSVVVVAVGFCTILSQLLISPADTISPLSGKDLVKKKVRLLSEMGGGYPSNNEFNFIWDGLAAQNVATNWPTPIVYSGWEIGNPIMSGGVLSSKTPVTNPVRKAYELYFGGPGNSRSSWDLTAALYACRGLGPYWDIHDTGHNVVASNGQNQWSEQELAGIDQGYLVAKMASNGVGAVLDSILVLPPRGATETKRSVPGKRTAPVRGPELLVSPMSMKNLVGSLYDVRGRRITRVFSTHVAVAGVGK